MQQIERGIYFEDSYPGVTLGAIVLPHGTILIDAPLRSEDARSWRASLVTLGSSTMRILVNLDANPDRTLGSRAMDCTIVAHQRAAQVFRNRPSIFKGHVPESGAEWESSNEVLGTRWASPDITFSQRILFHWGEKEVILEHRPGPGPGAIWVSVPSARVIFVGDAVLPDQPPFLAQADLPAWIDSLDFALKTYRGYTFISGRNGLVTTEAVRAQQQFLKKLHKGFERLGKRNAHPEKSESLIPKLLEDLPASQKSQEYYIQRLRYGLFHYYTRRYRPIEDAYEES